MLQQAVGDNSAVLVSFYQFLLYFLGQERIYCCEQPSKWMKKGIPARGRTGTGSSNPTVKYNSDSSCASGTSNRRRQSQGPCGDNVPLCGDPSPSFFHTYRGADATAALSGDRGLAPLPPCSLAARLHPPGAQERTSPSSQFIWSSSEAWDSIFLSEEDLIKLALNTTPLLFDQGSFKLLLKYCAQTSITGGIHRSNTPLWLSK